MSRQLYKREPIKVIRGFKIALIRQHAGCQICGLEGWGNLVVHHAKYRPTTEMSHLRLLCVEHHNLLHKFCSGQDRDLPRFTDVFIKGMKQENEYDKAGNRSS